MSDRKTFTFEYRGYTLTVVATNVDGEWHSHFHLKCRPDGRQYTLSGREGPYASAEEAFEKAKDWALQEIEQQVGTSLK
jgi:hypothetical protein